MSSIGSSAASMSGGYRPEMGGAGAVGGGSAYTRALEQDNAQISAGGSNAVQSAGSGTGGGSGRTFGSRVMGTIGLPLQVLAAGKDTLESGMTSTAGHAGLDHGAAGGRHVVIAQRRHSASAGQPQEADDGVQRTLQPVQPPSPPTQG